MKEPNNWQSEPESSKRSNWDSSDSSDLYGARDEANNFDFDGHQDFSDINDTEGATDHTLTEVPGSTGDNRYGESTTQKLSKKDCFTYGVSTGVQCLLIGSLYSALFFNKTTPTEATISSTSQTGIVKRFFPFLSSNIAVHGAKFGCWGGIYYFSKCHLIKLRKVDDDDVINSVIAGAIAGAVASMYTRNPRKMLTNGLLSGSTMGVMFTLSNTLRIVTSKLT